MEVVKKTENYIIIKKRSGRYGVKNTAGKWINGDEKFKILSDAGLVKSAAVKPTEEPTTEEADKVVTTATESTEATAEQ
jgi:hypothetical protein